MGGGGRGSFTREPGYLAYTSASSQCAAVTLFSGWFLNSCSAWTHRAQNKGVECGCLAAAKPMPGVCSLLSLRDPWDVCKGSELKRGKQQGAKPRAIMGVLRALLFPFAVWRDAADGPARHAACANPCFPGRKLPRLEKPRARLAMKPSLGSVTPWDVPVTWAHPSPGLEQVPRANSALVGKQS